MVIVTFILKTQVDLALHHYSPKSGTPNQRKYETHRAE